MTLARPCRRKMDVFPVAGLSFVLLFGLLAAETGQAQVGSNTAVIAAPPPPSNYLQLVTFTALVTGSDGGDPTGTVTFTTQDGFRLCIPVPLTQVSGASTASCATALLPVGANTITAAYNGDSNYNPSNGSVLYTVNGNIPTTTLSSESTCAGDWPGCDVYGYGEQQWRPGHLRHRDFHRF